MKNKNIVPSTESTLKVLQYLKKYKNRTSTSNEISEGVGISKSTCYRILQTLAKWSVVSYDKTTSKYSLGPYLMVLGSRAAEFMDYMQHARNTINEICDLVGCTTAISQKIGDSWVYIDKATPQSPYSLSISIGQEFPINTGATGKLIMSYMTKEEQKKILDEISLKKLTSQTIVDEKLFLKELEAVKKCGYATSKDEHFEGVSGLSFPVFNKFGDLDFAISIVFITNAQTMDDKIEIIEHKINELNKTIGRHKVL